MNELIYRLLVLVWFVCYMAAIYLALHVVVARFSRAPESRLLWFFSVVTGPLTRPVRALLPAGVPEARVRAIALGVYVLLMLVAHVAFKQFGGNPLG